MTHDGGDEQAHGELGSIATPEILFDLGATGSEVLARVGAIAPWIDEDLARLRRSLPLPSTAQPFEAGPWYRPMGHRRAFYRRCAGGGTLAFKGTEILADDAPLLAAWVREKHDLSESPLEQFPLLEHKAPGALLVDEAMLEAEAALALQARWVASYEGTARAPIPLLVVRWPEAALARYTAAMFPLVSARVRRILERLTRDGLAGYVYFYPGVTTRVTDLGSREETRLSGYAARREELAPVVSFERTIEAWIRLVARMFALGFFPVTLSHEQGGYAVQPQNAVIDGGFVDLDSLQPMASVRDEREFMTTFWVTLHQLSITVGALLGGVASPRLEKLLLVQHGATLLTLHGALRAALEEERARGLALDPRLDALIAADTSPSSLTRLFERCYP